MTQESDEYVFCIRPVLSRFFSKIHHLFLSCPLSQPIQMRLYEDVSVSFLYIIIQNTLNSKTRLTPRASRPTEKLMATWVVCSETFARTSRKPIVVALSACLSENVYVDYRFLSIFVSLWVYIERQLNISKALSNWSYMLFTPIDTIRHLCISLNRNVTRRNASPIRFSFWFSGNGYGITGRSF